MTLKELHKMSETYSDGAPYDATMRDGTPVFNTQSIETAYDYRNCEYVVRRDSDADEGHVCFKNAEDVEFVIANPNFREILDILLKH